MEKALKLHSPAGSEPVYYAWPLVITVCFSGHVSIVLYYKSISMRVTNLVAEVF